MLTTYEFNRHDVCVNSTVLYRNKCSKAEIAFRAACYEGFWETTVHYSTPYSGFSSAPDKTSMRLWEYSFEASVDYAFKLAVDLMNSTLKDNNSCKPDYLDEYVKAELEKLQRWYRIFKNNNYSLEIVEKQKIASQMVQASLF